MAATKRIVTFGPGPRFKGGIANYNTSLARALDRRGDVEVHIVSWTQQYPAIIPGAGPWPSSARWNPMRS
jgi:hypothetical protein